MPSYKAPVEDALFLLNDVFGFERYNNLPGLRRRDAGRRRGDPRRRREAVRGGARAAQPHRRPAKAAGATTDGSVTTPEGFKDAYDAYREGGWMGLSAPAEYGGQGLPYDAQHGDAGVRLVGEHGARHVSRPDPGRDRGAPTCTAREEQKATYLPKMIEGAWTGTMNLTEPHCGTDLGLLKTKAVPNGDGSYAISGTKIFISAGEHDLAENIVHLVLARIEGAPDGHEGHLALRRAEVPRRRGRLARRPQRRRPAARSSTRWASTATRPAS